jgi:hypothetical protein
MVVNANQKFADALSKLNLNQNDDDEDRIIISLDFGTTYSG